MTICSTAFQDVDLLHVKKVVELMGKSFRAVLRICSTSDYQQALDMMNISRPMLLYSYATRRHQVGVN